MTMSRIISGGLGAAGYALGVNRLLMRNRAVIAVFHRVDDRYGGTPITVTESEFKAYCDFFAAHFQVIPLSELMNRLRAGRPIGGALAITFDDGYRDNYLRAAPELRRRGLPACFYIATGFIGTEIQPHWDAERGIRAEWMGWDQVRELHRQGFEIGAHTVTHPDLGKITPEQTHWEATESRRMLEAELSAPITHFCYPFGRSHNITEANRQVIQDVGYASCAACYGGTVAPGDDPFRIRRAPIYEWHLTPGQYGLELLFDPRE
ncbi:MAG: polysaccharide deacetylase family protein [Gemmatimonadota bacterium]